MQESSERARLSPAEFEGWNDNDEPRTVSTPFHAEQYQDLNEDDTLEVESLVRLDIHSLHVESCHNVNIVMETYVCFSCQASNNECNENEGGSEVSTVRVSSSENGNSSSVIASSDVSVT